MTIFLLVVVFPPSRHCKVCINFNKNTTFNCIFRALKSKQTVFWHHQSLQWVKLTLETNFHKLFFLDRPVRYSLKWQKSQKRNFCPFLRLHSTKFLHRNFSKISWELLYIIIKNILKFHKKQVPEFLSNFSFLWI